VLESVVTDVAQLLVRTQLWCRVLCTKSMLSEAVPAFVRRQRHAREEFSRFSRARETRVSGETLTAWKYE